MLLASAYLPAFRLEKLGGKYYADGGVQDVVPIHALVEDGCKDIIALRIFGFGIEKRFRIPDDVHVTTIGPTVDLGNILNFDAEQSRSAYSTGSTAARIISTAPCPRTRRASSCSNTSGSEITPCARSTRRRCRRSQRRSSATGIITTCSSPCSSMTRARSASSPSGS